MNTKDLSERDVCTKLITPAVERAGWDIQSQMREEVSLTAGQVIVRGRLVARGKAKRADYVLYLKPNLPLAVVEAILAVGCWCADRMESSPGRFRRCGGT
jgi:type I restriction enzyme R subunit